jgi:hypothetical protein
MYVHNLQNPWYQTTLSKHSETPRAQAVHTRDQCMLSDVLQQLKMGDFLMEQLVPGLGVFIALAMFASPVFAVLKVMKTGLLGVRTHG